MPTIIALDNSLSMYRNVIPGRESRDNYTYHSLASKGINQLLEHLASTSKMEYVALVTYSATTEIVVDFTREYDVIRQVVKKIEYANKACVITMLKTVGTMLTTNWGTQTSQVVVFTDCGIGLGNSSLKNILASFAGKEKEPEYAWLTTLNCIKFNFICMGLHSDAYFSSVAIPLYQQMYDCFKLKGQLYVPKPPKDAATVTDADGALCGAKPSTSSTSNVTSSSSSHKSELGRTVMCELIERLCETSFKPYETILKCGGYFRLECPVLLWPPPTPFHSKKMKSVEMSLASKIEVCGFLAISEIGSPASLSRHLVLPKVERDKPTRRTSEKTSSSSQKSSSSGSGSGSTKATVLDPSQPNYEYEKLEQDIRDFYTKDTKDNDDSSDDVIEVIPPNKATNETQKETMCVLLHGALKMENAAAVVWLNENWFGFLYSYADSKKKSNLMLNILPPGNSIPWLGDFQMLGFTEDLMPGETGAFPVKAEKRSYSQSCVVWIRHVSLQSDVQKVLRHAKKMPDKTQHFYKELNRIRRAALSIGFVELLEAMAVLFDKESAQLSLGATNPECCFQLKHASVELRKPSNRDLKISIVPAQKFGSSAATGTSVSSGGMVGDGTTPTAPLGFNY